MVVGAVAWRGARGYRGGPTGLCGQEVRLSVKAFIEHHFRHFNAAVVVDASKAYQAHLDAGGKMMVTLAGAMSTAELGLSLAELIRRGKVHAITCTGAAGAATGAGASALGGGATGAGGAGWSGSTPLITGSCFLAPLVSRRRVMPTSSSGSSTIV